MGNTDSRLGKHDQIKLSTYYIIKQTIMASDMPREAMAHITKYLLKVFVLFYTDRQSIEQHHTLAVRHRPQKS